MRSIMVLVLLAASEAHAPPGGSSVTAPGICDVEKPEFAPIKSYHFHIHFLQNNIASAATAHAVQQAFVAAFFAARNGTAVRCTVHDVTEQKELCVWANDPCLGPIGPFTTAQWAVYAPLEHYAALMAWFQQRRRGLSVLVHPNSGCIELDHSTWPAWLGAPWALDLTQFDGEPPPTRSCPDTAVPGAYYPCCGTWDRL